MSSPEVNGFKLYWAQESDEIYAARSLEEAKAYVEGLIGEPLPDDEIGEQEYDLLGADEDGTSITLFEVFSGLSPTEPTQIWTAYA